MSISGVTEAHDSGAMRWRVLLVQIPLGNCFKSISAAVNGLVSADAVESVASTIEWDSTDTERLPLIKAQFTFVRHYALALIPKNVWHDKSTTLRDKFIHALFWEHPGTTNGKPVEPRNSIVWEMGQVEKIDGVQVIGDTHMSPQDVGDYYEKLMQNWDYTPLWWNCHDLAIRLAYLVVGTGALEQLQWLMRRLKQSLHSDILAKRSVGWSTLGIASFLGATTVAPSGALAFIGCGLAEAVGMPIADYAQVKGLLRNVNEMESRFPDLHELHHPLRELYSDPFRALLQKVSHTTGIDRHLKAYQNYYFALRAVGVCIRDYLGKASDPNQGSQTRAEGSSN